MKRVNVDVPVEKVEAVKKILELYMKIPQEHEQTALKYLQGLTESNNIKA